MKGVRFVLSAVNQWADQARVQLAKQVQVPLIDDTSIDMHAELWRARESGDESLRGAIDNLLSRDPDDLAARFVALNAYYRLMATEIPPDIQIVDNTTTNRLTGRRSWRTSVIWSASATRRG